MGIPQTMVVVVKGQLFLVLTSACSTVKRRNITQALVLPASVKEKDTNRPIVLLVSSTY